jgi:subfamily B ATP-binding cassette protein MsbA
MNTYFKILRFGRPFGKYAIPYFVYTLIHAAFNMVTFAMVVPVLDVIFEKADSRLVEQMPKFDILNPSDFDIKDYFTDLINYSVYKFFGVEPDKTSVLIFIAIVLISASLISNLFRYLGSYLMENFRIATIQKIRNIMYNKVMSLNVGYFSNQKKGDIISKFSNDVSGLQATISATLQVVFREPLMVIFYLVGMIIFSWKLTIFAAIFLPLVSLLIGAILKRLRNPARTAQDEMGRMASQLDESLSGIKIIKSYNAEGYSIRKYSSMNEVLARISRWMALRQQLASPMSEFLGIIASVVVVVFGGVLVLRGEMGASALIVYVGMFSQIIRPVRAFIDAFSTINYGIASGERVFELLDTPEGVSDRPDAVALKDFRESIEFRDVKFRYEDREIIKGVSFSVKKGETVALVGPSGGGKSTLSDLVPRFYDPQGGGVFIDGRDAREYTMESIRGHLGMVAQETVLFNDSIANNIRLGVPDASMEDVIAAARVANAHNFIMETENGYDTNIGDRGVKLSGGQRQRLSIARAVLKNPDILILDEATSALDTESEKLVQAALESLLAGRTSLVIAHRLSTIQGADRIVVIDRGEIIEEGTHTELMTRKGMYSRLVEMQQVKERK